MQLGAQLFMTLWEQENLKYMSFIGDPTPNPFIKKFLEMQGIIKVSSNVREGVLSLVNITCPKLLFEFHKEVYSSISIELILGFGVSVFNASCIACFLFIIFTLKHLLIKKQVEREIRFEGPN